MSLAIFLYRNFICASSKFRLGRKRVLLKFQQCDLSRVGNQHDLDHDRNLTVPPKYRDNAPSMKAPRFLLRGFRRPREVASLALGKLEGQVLDETWRRGEVCVRDIYVAF